MAKGNKARRQLFLVVLSACVVATFVAPLANRLITRIRTMIKG